VKNKKKVAVLGAIAVCAGLSIAFYAHLSADKERAAEAANPAGVVNPSAMESLATQPVPQLSERTFTPAPSVITGSYTDPAAQEDAKKKDSAKNTSAAKDSGK
jgi:hypothetical protein